MKPAQLLKLNCRAIGMRNYAVLMGDGSATITGGFGGWTSHERPDNISFTEWNGQEPIRQDIPIMFDGFKHHEDYEATIRSVLQLARNGNNPPPVFTMRGPIYYRHLRWVLENVTFDEGSRRRSKDGRVIRQAMTLSVMQYIDADSIDIKKRKRKKKNGKGNHKPRVVRAKEKDNVIQMAIRFYGDRSKWKLILKSNPKLPKDPHKHLPKGTKVKIPAG